VGAEGNLYVDDYENKTMRRVSPAGGNWNVTTIAGQAGTSGTSDGTNRDATFAGPQGMTIDPTGALFVADSIAGLIRKLTPVGSDWVVTTIAGHQGEFRFPQGITMDKSGSLYVADSDAWSILKLTPVGGHWVVHTIAGGHLGPADGTNGAAQFFSPASVAVDSVGNLFVADYNASTIRKVTPVGTNWVVTTIAGLASSSGSSDGTNSAARFSWPRAVAVDNQDRVFVAEEGNSTIRQLSAVGTNWVVTTIGGLAGDLRTVDGTNSQARFNDPHGLVVDNSGNIFVTEAAGDVVRLGQSRPQLQLLVSGNQAILSWPAWAVGFLAETSSSLAPGAVWITLEGAALGDSGFSLTNACGGFAYFRLRLPNPR